MRFGRGLRVLLLGLASACAHAGDAPLIQPPADWVRPAVLDPTASRLAKDAPTAVLLQDSQVRFQPDGAAFYREVAIKAQTSQGLAAIGSVTVPWDPATQRLTIHKLKVLRDGKEIDYLANGPGFLTLRRETKLEAAILDGTLTATTQIEGLEVGDILDFAYTTEYADPIMKGHVEADFALNMGPVHQSHLRVTWPSSMSVTWRGLSHAPNPVVRTKGEWIEASLDREDPVDPIPPEGAPLRYLRGPELQFGNFAGWSGVSALLAAEFAEAEQLAPASPLREEVKSITARYPDAKSRAEAALALVQDKIRYVLLALNGGGLKPAAADLTWTRRFADCKGKTVVLLALLRELGIEAEPALASLRAGDGLDQRLPLVSAFDHVLVRATIDGRVYWLDGTRTGDRSLDKIRTPPFHWVLPMRAAGGELIPLDPQDFQQPLTDSSIRFDASAGLTLPAPVQGEILLRGDAAIGINLALSSLPPAKLDEALKTIWHKHYDYIEIKSATAQFDGAAQEERLVMDGTATLDWRTGGGYEVSDARFQKLDVQRQPGPDSDAPYAVAFPRFDRELVTVVLPALDRSFGFLGPQVDETVAGMHLIRRLSIQKGVFTAEMETHATMQEFPASEAEAASKRLAELAKLAVRILPPRGGAGTPSERAAGMVSTPETRDQYLTRGNTFLDSGKYDEALADFDMAISLDPSSATAWADRAITWAWKGEAIKAHADAEHALQLNPREIVAFRADGVAAMRKHQWSEAVTAFSAGLAITPKDVFSLYERAEAYLHLYDAKRALQDLDTGLSSSPGNIAFLAHKCSALIELDRRAEAAELARAMIADHPDNADALSRGAQMLQRAGDDEGAWRAIDRAVSLKPTVAVLLARADMHPFGDLDRRSDDVRRALELDGKSKEALMTLAKLNYWAGNSAEALKWGTQALQRNPDDVAALALVGVQHHALGEDSAAAADFAQVRKAAGTDGEALYHLCWSEATAGFDLSGALADCEASLRAWPNFPPALSGRAFLLLRLGRNEEAVAAYDALLSRPAAVQAWFGRSIAERRIGRTEAADRDRDEAVHREKNVADWFRLYGVTE